jgi:anti-anti-sigma regulatory factor
MLAWIKRLLAAPVFEGDEDKTRIAGLLNIVLLAVFVAASILTLLTSQLSVAKPGSLATGAATAILALAMWFIMQRGHVQLVSVLLSSMLLVNVTIAVYFGGTIRDPITTVYIICIVIAGLLVGYRAAIAFTLLSILVLFGLFKAETAGLLAPVTQTSVAITDWVTHAVVFGITTVLLGLAIRSINNALERALYYAAELKQEAAERERPQQEVIEAQRQSLQELSSPIIPVMDRIIVMPLIGGIDTMRARDVTRALLAGIREHRAQVVILDITGVPIIDSGIASHLNKTIQAARLKGARTIVTGVSDAVAETIVDLGIDWKGIETLADLRTGLVTALNSLGFKLTR